jgi:hypothetical protein
MTKGFGLKPQISKLSRPQSIIGQAITSVETIQAKLCDYVKEIPDPRVTRSKRHQLQDILLISILAVIAGAEAWDALH